MLLISLQTLLALNTKFVQLRLWILCLISPIGSRQNYDRRGPFQMENDGKVNENVSMTSFTTILSERDMEKLVEYSENP